MPDAALGTVPQALAVQRAFVASYGLDANPCSVTSPCRGFAAALAVTDVGGEVIVLDSAGYGALSIAKSVSFIADGVYAGVTVFSGTGISISGPNVRVTLRGLSLNGQGGVVGIRFAAGSELLIDRCTVSGMGSSGIHVEGGGQVTVTRSASLRNGGDGVLVGAPGAQVVLHEVRTEILISASKLIFLPASSPFLSIGEGKGERDATLPNIRWRRKSADGIVACLNLVL